MVDRSLNALARRRVRAKLGWYQHALVYLLVNAGMTLLALSQDRYWSIFPVLGWGLGLLLHGARVWCIGSTSALFNRMVARERAAMDTARGDPW